MFDFSLLVILLFKVENVKMRMHVTCCLEMMMLQLKNTNGDRESTPFQYLIEQLKYSHSPSLQWNARSKNTDLVSNIWQLWPTTIFLLYHREELHG